MNEIADRSVRFRQVCQLLLSQTVGAVTRMTLLPRVIGVVRVTGVPEINLPWEISMVTSKRRTKPPITFNEVNS